MAEEKNRKASKNRAAATLGAKGGKARAAKLSKEQKNEIAKKGALARWGDRPVQATHAGTINIVGSEFICANLPDGRRVISEKHVMEALDRGYSGYYSQRDAQSGGEAVPRILSPKALRPFFPTDESALQLLQPIAFLPPPGQQKQAIHGKQVLKGINAEALAVVCEIWLKARDSGALTGEAQLRTAAKADILIRGLARIGIVALVDEATGFQRERARNALAEVLEAFVTTELAKWEKTFGDDFYREMFRIRGWDPNDFLKRPGVVGRWTTDIVYKRLAPGVLQRLQEVIPRDSKGRLKFHLHRGLTRDKGYMSLKEHLSSVTTIMRLTRDGDWKWFKEQLDKLHPQYPNQQLLPFMKKRKDSGVGDDDEQDD
ncbi:P63C domain-containing protein [Myxococcus sp. AB036A]|uniref:P63C domain-containing protein n=1 Tax=Myxococcus sp. AB036A TaxID=2562793 RepID=UPI0018910A7E|nr:P63C domain-containing protein [Myxococcus sp. AB036A]